jgi:hypothetical protein
MSVLRPTVKLTAITITYNGKKIQEFLMLRYEDGKAILDNERLQKLLKKLSVPTGATITIG